MCAFLYAYPWIPFPYKYDQFVLGIVVITLLAFGTEYLFDTSSSDSHLLGSS